MARGINIRDAILDTLTEYTEEVRQEINLSARKNAREAVKKLKKNTSTIREGNYNKTWKVVKQGNSYVVYNASKTQISHILENGYAYSDGSRRFSGITHIAPVEKATIEEFQRDVERIVQGRGN